MVVEEREADKIDRACQAMTQIGAERWGAQTHVNKASPQIPVSDSAPTGLSALSDSYTMHHSFRPWFFR